MRGVVSLAAALTLPEQFPGRDIILVVTFSVIAATIILLGLTLGPLAKTLVGRKFLLMKDSSMSEADVRAVLAHAQLEAVTSHSLGEDGVHRHPRLVEQYGYRAAVADDFLASAAKHAGRRAEHLQTVLVAIAAGRTELLRLFKLGRIHDSLMHKLEAEFDYEEINSLHMMDAAEVE
jgi:monovalent cation/hydrogen antiporter